MYLKNIEVQGFKSFANRIVFDFHNGITGIVGPNGSGKSNVADAVRWVLGEQRIKQLRGGNMQDVIFSGTESRKPLSYASVAITLDNSDHQLPVDFEEVKVTRKLYRSGESEYLINGSVCRLKDINEMFYDTGIGKEGYSIIGQGQIDKILSGKPEDRRELFDEAAGIVKFKRRKSMSLKKLEEEQQNLLRVTDILAELEKQFGPLQRQSETAKTYLKKKEELKRFDINMFLMETMRLKKLIAEMDENITIAQNQLDDSSKRYDDMKLEYEKIEEQVDLIDADIETLRTQLNETSLLRQQLENQIELLKEQINSAKMSDDHYNQRKSSISAELEERDRQRVELLREQQEIEDKINSEKQQQISANENLMKIQSHIAEMSAKIEKDQNEIITLLNNRASTKAKVQHYDTMLQQITVRRAELNKRLIELGSEKQRQNELAEVYAVELKDISEKIIQSNDKIKSFEGEISKLQKEITNKNEELRGSQNLYHREHSRLESLKNLTERYDGYGNSIRKVMERKSVEPGLLGVVADIIKVDKKYEVAIETALGGSIQNVVTKDEETAKRMIAYLKQNKLGRATFLPLTAIKGGQGFVKPEVLKEKGVLGTADKLAIVSEKYTKLAENLLGRTIVADHIDTGIFLARKYNQSLRIVTLEGDLINPGGAMSGGAYKNASNLLSRRREIEELERSVKQLQQKCVLMQEEVEVLRNKRTSFYDALEELQKDIQKDYLVQNTAKMNLDQVRASQNTSKESEDAIYRERAQLEKEVSEIIDNQESIHVELETNEQLEKDLNSKMEHLQMELEKEREIESIESKKNEEVRLFFASLEQKLSFTRENISRIEEESEKFRVEMEQLDENKGENSEEILQKEQQIKELRLTIEESKELLQDIQEEITAAQSRKEDLNKRHREFLSKREYVSKQMSELDKEIFRLNSKKEGYEETSEKQINYMWEEYELTYNRALEIRDENLTDLTYIKKSIQELKSEIKALGPVNVNAIEDFKNLAERYEFMKTQHSDLLEAEITLKQIVEELDAAMRKQFEEQFSKINSEFNQVFKELFGGGKGTLELVEEEDILEAGIRIIAQPPGKKLQNMMQLSGGEKALTAIALLFAIQNLKPSPFCLLDEIEAALDDSNVTRFADYLHKLTKHTQFIVITHRRGTMTAADRLYGITMQERGVSTLVSVDLLEHELEKEK